MIKEYIYEDDRLVEYYLIHRRVKLLSNKAVGDFNTTYIPQYYQSETIIEKASNTYPYPENIPQAAPKFRT